MGSAATLPIALTELFLRVAQKIDGAQLVAAKLAADPQPAPTAVLAIGKVAFPMWSGLQDAGFVPTKALLVAPATRFPSNFALPAGANALVSDHPNPSERSLAAGAAALAFVESLGPSDRLLVLLSGGGSSLVCAPAQGLSLEDKRNAAREASRGGASIAELNTIRKHLSRLKGGQLGVASRAATTVWALSDVVGNDPATIASGPFSPDPTTFSEAESLLQRLAPNAPQEVKTLIARGVRGEIKDTPKPGGDQLAHVRYEILASPERVAEEARAAVEQQGLAAGLLSQNVESDVESLATAYVRRAQHEAQARGRARVFVGNGEPSIIVRGSGKGGRATHLALLVAKGIAGLSGVSFLAAGTDDRDGSADAAGAQVTGATWAAIQAAGVDPEAALANSDSASALSVVGALVRGPGSSNLLDLHLLGIAG